MAQGARYSVVNKRDLAKLLRLLSELFWSLTTWTRINQKPSLQKKPIAWQPAVNGIPGPNMLAGPIVPNANAPSYSCVMLGLGGYDYPHLTREVTAWEERCNKA